MNIALNIGNWNGDTIPTKEVAFSHPDIHIVKDPDNIWDTLTYTENTRNALEKILKEEQEHIQNNTPIYIKFDIQNKKPEIFVKLENTSTVDTLLQTVQDKVRQATNGLWLKELMERFWKEDSLSYRFQKLQKSIFWIFKK